MKTIGEVLVHSALVAGRQLKTAAESVDLDVSKVQMVFERVSNASFGVATLGTLAGVYFAGRACCSTRLRGTQKMTSFLISAACFASVGYEIYANGVNLGFITLIKQ
ncbi:MAG: hypothetical protein P0S96_04165 [Simkaniaceae bacterium]|nr:hypothetical protein [Candidatus Sacchlamyda saccharinae]